MFTDTYPYMHVYCTTRDMLQNISLNANNT